MASKPQTNAQDQEISHRGIIEVHRLPGLHIETWATRRYKRTTETGFPLAKSAIHRHFAGLSKNTFLLALASLFADISSEMLYPVLPVFLTQTLKATGSIVGL